MWRGCARFPLAHDFQVDMRKVNMTVLRPWIVNKIVELLGFEDELLVEYALGLLEDPVCSLLCVLLPHHLLIFLVEPRSQEDANISDRLSRQGCDHLHDGPMEAPSRGTRVRSRQSHMWSSLSGKSVCGSTSTMWRSRLVVRQKRNGGSLHRCSRRRHP